MQDGAANGSAEPQKASSSSKHKEHKQKQKHRDKAKGAAPELSEPQGKPWLAEHILVKIIDKRLLDGRCGSGNSQRPGVFLSLFGVQQRRTMILPCLSLSCFEVFRCDIEVMRMSQVSACLLQHCSKHACPSTAASMSRLLWLRCRLLMLISPDIF